MSRRRASSAMDIMQSQHSQRALTEMAGERIAELLCWRKADALRFAVVIWPHAGEDAKATTFVSTNDSVLAVKLSAMIGDHEAGEPG